jgi:hypothetical protein
MYQRGEPSLAAGMWSLVAGCCASVDVPLESTNKELAMEQASSCHSGCPVKVCSCDDTPDLGPWRCVVTCEGSRISRLILGRRRLW